MKEKIRRVLCAWLCLALLLGAPAALADTETYQGQSKGFGGMVTATLTYEDGKLVNVELTGDSETAGIGSTAIETLPAAILASGSADVEAVAGATVTSNAVKAAVQQAMDEAMGISHAENSFVPGTYSGSAVGFGGEIKVSVTVDADKIVSINVLEHQETNGIGSTAVDLLPQRMIQAQSTAVDTISGCTASSNALITAVEEALVAAGGNLVALRIAPEKTLSTQVVEITKDVVVVGGGAAGKMASIVADQNGADVLLLEKQAFLGGAAAISGGHVISTGSRHQKEGGVEDDTPDVLYQDLMEGGHNLNDPVMARLLADNVGEAFDYLCDYVHIRFEDTPTPNASHSKDRDFYHPEQSAGINADFKARIQELGIDVMLETRAQELKVEDGKVVGVIATGADGTTYDITAKAVILATGGFGNNKDMLTDTLKNVLYYGPVSSTGDGHKMAEAVGAKFQKMELGKVRGNGIKVGEGISKSTTNGNKAAVREGSGILVNRDGVRVVNENGTNDSVTKALMAQSDGMLFVVMDQATHDLFHAANVKAHVVSDENVENWIANNGSTYPVYIKNDTLEGAAQAAGIDPEALVKTVEQYNQYVAQGVDPDFGRDTLNAAIGEGPYYIVEQRARFASTLGGVVTTTQMEIVNQQDEIIPGLYGAGEIVGGAHGDDALPGCNLGWAYTTGMIAARAACQAIQ